MGLVGMRPDAPCEPRDDEFPGSCCFPGGASSPSYPGRTKCMGLWRRVVLWLGRCVKSGHSFLGRGEVGAGFQPRQASSRRWYPKPVFLKDAEASVCRRDTKAQQGCKSVQETLPECRSGGNVCYRCLHQGEIPDAGVFCRMGPNVAGSQQRWCSILCMPCSQMLLGQAHDLCQPTLSPPNCPP